VYDGSKTSTVTQTGVVLQGIAPNALVQNWGEMYLV
jgi:hypothetical protein